MVDGAGKGGVSKNGSRSRRGKKFSRWLLESNISSSFEKKKEEKSAMKLGPKRISLGIVTSVKRMRARLSEVFVIMFKSQKKKKNGKRTWRETTHRRVDERRRTCMVLLICRHPSVPLGKRHL